MNHRIDIPDDLRRRILEDKARLHQQCDGGDQARHAVQLEIKTLESTQAGLVQRMAALQIQAVASDASAQELANVERRASAIRVRLDQLRAQPMPSIDLSITFGVLFDIIGFYRPALQNLLLRDLAPWGIHERDLHFILGQIEAFSTLRTLNAWFATAPLATPGNIARMAAIYARALRGECDLHQDTIGETAADATSKPPNP